MFLIARQTPSDEMGPAPQVFVYKIYYAKCILYMIYIYVQCIYVCNCIYLLYNVTGWWFKEVRFFSSIGKTGKQRKVHVGFHDFPSDVQLGILDQGKENPPSLLLVNLESIRGKSILWKFCQQNSTILKPWNLQGRKKIQDTCDTDINGITLSSSFVPPIAVGFRWSFLMCPPCPTKHHEVLETLAQIMETVVAQELRRVRFELILRLL